MLLRPGLNEILLPPPNEVDWLFPFGLPSLKVSNAAGGVPERISTNDSLVFRYLTCAIVAFPP